MTHTFDQTTADQARILHRVAGESFVFDGQAIVLKPFKFSNPTDAQSAHIAGLSGDIAWGGDWHSQVITIEGAIYDTDNNSAVDVFDELRRFLRGDLLEDYTYEIYQHYHASDTQKIRKWYPCRTLHLEHSDPLFLYDNGDQQWMTFSVSITASTPEAQNGAPSTPDTPELFGPLELTGDLLIYNTDGDLVLRISAAAGSLECAGNITTQIGPIT